MTTLAARFAEDRGAPQRVDGVLVHMMYRRKVPNGARALLTWTRTADSPPPGVCIKVAKGTVTINDQEIEQAVLWADTSPEQVEILCNTKGSEGELRVWNCWRDEDGVKHAWIRNAGIVVEESDDGGTVILRCSSGPGDFTPGELELMLSFPQ